ncbi:MAG: Fic family protein [Bacteroidota bacterium]
MDVVEIIERIDFLKTQIDELRPISPDILNRINRKFRFDWSYHSSNIEGNSLTYGETKAFLLHGLTAGGKPFRDHLEIRGHNEAILELEDIVSNNKPISELVIRQLHQMIFGIEPYNDEAFTPDGKNTHRTIYPGRYKSQPNYVTTTTGEQIDFTSPEDTAPKMQELIEWLRNELLKKEIHPLTLAATFHYRFIMIHPFDDGNGRIARLLMNLILMMNNFLPAIIHTEDKVNYLRALQQANIGDLDSFVIYLGEQLIRSLELFLKGAYGENIEDLDEVDKKIALFKAKLKKPEEGIKHTRRSEEAILHVVENSVIPLFKTTIQKLSHFDELFFEKNIAIAIKKSSNTNDAIRLNSISTLEIFTFLKDNASIFLKNGGYISLSYFLRMFNREIDNNFDVTQSISVWFGDYKFGVVNSKNVILSNAETVNNFAFKKFYYETLTNEECAQIANVAANNILEHIQQNVKL